MITENEARRLMHEAVDALEPSPGQLGAIRAGRVRRTRQRRWVISGVAVATAAAVVVAAVALSDTASRKPSLHLLGPPAVNGWTPIAASPGPAGSVKVWTGHELVVAGDCCSTDVVHDLHAYNPETRHWRDLPPTPLSPRGSPLGVWTGKELIVVGGDGVDASGDSGQLRDGAAVNPVTGKWHRIAPAPDGFSFQGARAVWTGKQMLVFRSGGSMSATGDERVMAYDPRTDTWRVLPPSGLSLRIGAAVVWTGKGLFVWGGYTQENQASRLPDGAVLNPETGTWTPVAPAPIASRATPATALTPAGVFVWGGDGPPNGQLADGAIYDPTSNSWRALPAGPMTSTNNPQAAWTGHEVFVTGQHFGEPVVTVSTGVFELHTFTWRTVSPPPGADGDQQAVHYLEFVGWTGTDVLLVQRSTPIRDGMTNVRDDQLDGFTWTPTE